MSRSGLPLGSPHDAQATTRPSGRSTTPSRSTLRSSHATSHRVSGGISNPPNEGVDGPRRCLPWPRPRWDTHTCGGHPKGAAAMQESQGLPPDVNSSPLRGRDGGGGRRGRTLLLTALVLLAVPLALAG